MNNEYIRRPLDVFDEDDADALREFLYSDIVNVAEFGAPLYGVFRGERLMLLLSGNGMSEAEMAAIVLALNVTSPIKV